MAAVPTVEMRKDTCKIIVNVSDQSRWEAQGWVAAGAKAAAEAPAAEAPKVKSKNK
jgi:hypothetical protein